LAGIPFCGEIGPNARANAVEARGGPGALL
jgi:hypothetical protein